MQWAKQTMQRGFTIIELLVVIVVIAILAAITIVAYNGIQQQARGSAMSAELAQVGKAVELYKATSQTARYPSSLTQLTNTTVNPSVNYFYNEAENTYCMDMVQGNVIKSLGKRSGQRDGRCNLNGLVAWFPFNNSIIDSIAGREPTVVGSVEFGESMDGRTGGAYTSSEGSILRLSGAQNIPSGAGPLTVSAWVRGVGSSGSDYSYAVFRGASHTLATSVFWLGISSGSNYAGAVSGKYVQGESSISASASVWRHLVVTYDGNIQTFYVDGQQVRQEAIGSITNNLNSTLGIGGSPSSTSRGFVGRIDDVRVYDRELSAIEVTNLYDIGAY
jgi:prepilin-type N-terminal cleavage/methylation domain-containing protein